MMTKLENKLVFLLADTSVKQIEIDKFIKKLKNGGLENCLNKALMIRNILKNSDDDIDQDWLEPVSNYDREIIAQDWPESVSNYDRKIIKQVYMLLRTEAGMTAKDAIKALSKELTIKIPSSKRSFNEQLLYICKNTEGSQIVHIAHKIRNEFVHDSSKSDWPLKIR